MNSVDTNEILNFLSVIHCRSLATYLTYAQPWFDGNDEAKQTLDLIAEQHRQTSDRIAELIIENGGDASNGEYPMTFTSLHDLGVGYILRLAIRHQQTLIEQIQECVEQLTTAPMAKGIAEEALGEARGHLQSLEDLVAAEA